MYCHPAHVHHGWDRDLKAMSAEGSDAADSHKPEGICFSKGTKSPVLKRELFSEKV